MNKFFTFFLLFISFQTYTQNLTLKLKSGTFELEQKFNFDDLETNPYRIITFKEIPNELQKNELKSQGINFLYYLPTNSYVVSLEKEIQLNYLLQNKVISVNKIITESKIDYKKAGVIVTSLIPSNNYQLGIFQNEDYRHKHLMKTIDYINLRYGEKIKLANQDLKRKLKIKQNFLSPCYTTKMADVIKIK